MNQPNQTPQSKPINKANTYGPILLTLTLTLLFFVAGLVTLSLDRPSAAAPTASQASDAESSPEVYIYYNAAESCALCTLHVWRLAYYADEFEEMGATVYGVPVELADGSPELSESLGLPWPLVYDLSKNLQRYHGVDVSSRNWPQVVIVDEGAVVYRGHPDALESRPEADVLTTLSQRKVTRSGRVAKDSDRP